MRTLAEIDAAIETCLSSAEERQQAADPSLRGLRPSTTDWATQEELAELNRLQLERATHPEATAAAARARVAAKRAARRKQRES